jgi:hypothetical protein
MCTDGLLIKCNKCDGKGLVINTDDSVSFSHVECPDCYGHRRVISHAGRAIVELIQFALDSGALRRPEAETSTGVGPYRSRRCGRWSSEVSMRVF